MLAKHDPMWDIYPEGRGKKSCPMYQGLYRLVAGNPKVTGELKRSMATPGQFDSPDSKRYTRSETKRQKLEETPKFADDDREAEAEEESGEYEQEEASDEASSEGGQITESEGKHSYIREAIRVSTYNPDAGKASVSRSVQATHVDDAAYLNSLLAPRDGNIGDIAYCHQQLEISEKVMKHWRGKLKYFLGLLRKVTLGTHDSGNASSHEDEASQPAKK